MPAVPQPLGRLARVRRGRRAVRQRRRRRRASTSPTTGRMARRSIPVATRRPAWRHADGTHGGGRGAPRARTCARRPTRPASTAPSCAWIRRPGPAWPATRLRPAPTRTPDGSSAMASATRSGSAIRPGTNEVWAGDVGWSTWEELNRLVTPADATVDNFGWPCYEGGGPQGSVRRPEPERLREPVHSRDRRRRRRRTTPIATATRSSAARPAATARARRRRDGVLPGWRLPGRVRRRALLRRLQPRLPVGDDQGRRTGCPTRPRARTS